MNGTGGGFSNLFPIIMVALTAAGVFVKQTPLRSDRAADPPHSIGTLTLDSDDPFAAETQGGGSKTATHVAAQLRDRIKEIIQTGGQVRIIGVSLWGSSYPEAAESRRRTRLAVLSALRFHGYNSDAIGYFHVKLPDGARNVTWPDPKSVGLDFTLIGPAGSGMLLELVRERAGSNPVDLTVPYEWFKPSVEALPLSDKRKLPPDVLVLWLNEDKLATGARKKLGSLISNLTPAPANPQLTSINNAKQDSPNDTPKIFVPSATIPACELAASMPVTNRLSQEKMAESTWNCFMNNSSQLNELTRLPIIRTILTDDVLAAALLWELWQRGVNRTHTPVCRDGLVLIVEDGSAQSLALSRSLSAGFYSNCRGSVRTYGYHPLLDSGRAYIDSSRKEDSVKSEALNWQFDTGSIDRAEGRSQYDYLRRLGDEIAILDRDPSFATSGVKAIGIVGSDVYDKMLILQALRTRFKDKIFFTTGLDARYLYASQKKWTRNLVIATGFDLSLRPALQQSTIPFRDGYQTATYLAALMALEAKPLDYWNGKLKDWLRPQIFAIGRSGAVHLASPSIEDLKKWIESNYSEASAPPAKDTNCDDWAMCKNIEPMRPQQGIRVADVLAISILILLGGLAIALNHRVQKASRDAYEALTSSTPADARVARFWLFTVLALVGAVLATVVFVRKAIDESFAQGAGEPFLWLEGISVWPSIILLFVGLVVMIFLVIIFTIRIRHQANLISKDFDLPTPQTWKLARPRWSASLIGPHLDLTSFDPNGNFNPKTADEGVEITSLWQNYLRATCWREMWWWVLISTLLMFLLAFGFVYFYGTPSFPHRGPLVETLYRRLEVLNVMLLWLVVFWVGYETRACSRFVTIVSDVRCVWPKSLLDREEVKTGIPRAHLDDYLDFQMTVSATRRIHSLIYLPFILLLFLVLSQSPLFDAMDFPLGQVFIIGSALAYALYTAVFLRMRAEAVRAKTLANYNSQLLIQLGPKNSQPTDASHQETPNSPLVSPEQIKLLMERIRGTREGAFAPFSQQPAVQALLLPFGGYGGVQLIEYLLTF